MDISRRLYHQGRTRTSLSAKIKEWTLMNSDTKWTPEERLQIWSAKGIDDTRYEMSSAQVLERVSKEWESDCFILGHGDSHYFRLSNAMNWQKCEKKALASLGFTMFCLTSAKTQEAAEPDPHCRPGSTSRKARSSTVCIYDCYSTWTSLTSATEKPGGEESDPQVSGKNHDILSQHLAVQSRLLRRKEWSKVKSTSFVLVLLLTMFYRRPVSSAL